MDKRGKPTQNKKRHRHGIKLKKKFGQHFLCDQEVAYAIVNKIDIAGASVFEIGPGSGFLTKTILEEKIERLWCFEIDPEWVNHLQKSITDERCTIIEANILDIDFALFEPHAPWILLANLPYQVTFPILHKLQRNRKLLQEGVIMVQEEVAQKIVKKSGRGYGYASLFFQHYFEWELLNKIPPEAFEPPPKVFSRLLYFKSRQPEPIQNEEKFWKFIKLCFASPRRTLRNNLATTHIDMSIMDENLLNLRAQQLSMEDLLNLWNKIGAK